MSHGFLQIVRYFFLALLWLFFIYAARMALVDSRRQRREAALAAAGAEDPRKPAPVVLRVLEPAEHRGRNYEVADELTLGRSPACVVVLENDTFASSVHARVFRQDGDVFVEDLGSTNGTYVNGERLAAPTQLKRGDHLKVGSTVLEVRR